MRLSCQTLGFLSIVFAAFWCGAHAVSAAGLEQCRGVSAAWDCQGGRPILRIESEGAARDLDLFVAATHPKGPIGNRVLRMERGQPSAILPMSRPAKVGFDLSVLGESDAVDGPCCLISVFVPKAPSCDVVEDAPEGPTDPNPVAPADYSVTLKLWSPCPVTASGNTCRGSLSLARSKDAPGLALPLSLDSAASTIERISVTGPFTCVPAGSDASQFCQVPGAAVPDDFGLTLPVTVTAPPSFDRRTATVCAGFRAPDTPAAQTAVVQTALAALGFDPGPADGAAGPKTRAAVAEFAKRYGLEETDPIAPAVLSLLGLAAVEDADPDNNQSCTSVELLPTPRPKCDSRTAVERDGQCACRYARMFETRDKTACRCIKGTRFVAGKGCLYPRSDVVDDVPPPPNCDAKTTVLRGGKCMCRFDYMTRVSPTKCACPAGVECG